MFLPYQILYETHCAMYAVVSFSLSFSLSADLIKEITIFSFIVSCRLFSLSFSLSGLCGLEASGFGCYIFSVRIVFFQLICFVKLLVYLHSSLLVPDFPSASNGRSNPSNTVCFAKLVDISFDCGLRNAQLFAKIFFRQIRF